MKGFNRFRADLLEATIPTIKKLNNREIQLTEKEETLVHVIFKGFTEISKSLEVLKLSRRLANSAPPRLRGLEKNEYLEYHMNAFLHESYIFKCRLNSYSATLIKVFLPQVSKAKRKEVTKPIIDWIEQQLLSTTEIRGQHVHASRYDNEYLIDARMFEFSANNSDEGILKDAAKLSLSIAKNDWISQIDKFLKDLERMADAYFDLVYPIVFTNQKIILPNPEVINRAQPR